MSKETGGHKGLEVNCVITSCLEGGGPSMASHLHVSRSLLPAPHSLFLSNVSPSDCWHQVHGWCDKQGEDGFLWEAAVASLPRKHLLEVQWDGHRSGGSRHSGYLRLQRTSSQIPHSARQRACVPANNEALVLWSQYSLAFSFLFFYLWKVKNWFLLTPHSFKKLSYTSF